MTGSPAPDQFWAKLRYRDDDPSTGEIVEWRPLIAHSAEVSGVRMMALFDTNVLIDAAVASRSHHRAAVRLIAAAKYNVIGGLVTPTSIATCWYVAHEGEQTGPRPLFELLADVMCMAPMGRSALRTALRNPGTRDFDDGYFAAAGAAVGAAAVAIRNESDLRSTALTPYHQLDLVKMLDE